ncbi:MAG: hypothetical protein GKS07_11100 [Nitrosopumilus sp.]|nr:MAG: hypothetical protein GKS07_11100 [Nitrosopumilus sp.]
MIDPLKARLDNLRKFSESAKRRADLYSNISNFDDAHTARSLGALRKASAPGKKLQKVGFLMLWIPEPTGITCAIGGPLIVAGRYLDKKYNSSTLNDVGHQTKSTILSISDFKNSVL